MRYLIFFFLASCAFKKEDAVDLGDARVLQVASISWEDENGRVLVKRNLEGGKNYSLPDPISLPHSIPDKITISLNSPLASGKILAEPKITIIDATEEKITTSPYRLRGRLEPSLIEVEGLKTFFSIDRQQRGIMKISFLNAITGEEETSLGLTLVSTPISSGISLKERALVKNTSLRRVIFPQMRFDLLKVLKIENEGKFPKEYIFPSELIGSLKRDFRRYDVVEQECSSESSQNAWTEIFETRFFLIPLDSASVEDFLVRIYDNNRLIALGPNETQFIGIYGSGKALASFVDSGVPTENHSLKKVVESCYVDTSLEGLRKRKTEKIEKYVEVGMDSGPVQWNFDESRLKVFVRNAFLSRADDPAARSFVFLNSQLTIL